MVESQNEILIGSKIFSGFYSKVYRGRLNEKVIAVKVIDLEKASVEYRTKFLPREMNIIRKLRHPHIITFYDIHVTSSRIFFLMELANHGDLLQYIEKNGAISEEKCRVWLKQVSDALLYVHNCGVAHRDVKLENILLDKRWSAKLTDFGFARCVSDGDTDSEKISETFCGTLAYCAPEVIMGHRYNPFHADVWSFGVVLFVMLNNGYPFDFTNVTRMVDKQLSKQWSFNKKFENRFSTEVKKLIEASLEPDPLQRISLSKLCYHAWFDKLRTLRV